MFYHPRGPHVGEGQEIRTHASGRCGREQAHDAPSARPNCRLNQTTERLRSRVQPHAPRESHRDHENRGDRQPRADHAGDVGREAQPQRGDGEAEPGAREQDRSGAGARMRPSEPPQPRRGAGHRVELTA